MILAGSAIFPKTNSLQPLILPATAVAKNPYQKYTWGRVAFWQVPVFLLNTLYMSKLTK
jgi:hypothetical protein